MEEFITDERTGLQYELVGNYYLIAGEDEPEGRPIGIWGQRHLRYIRKHKVGLYAELLTTGKLNDYLADLNEQAEAMFSRLVNVMAEKQGVTEQLKATKPMLWVGKMNAVRSTAILKDQRLLFNTFIQKQYVETLCFSKVPFTVFKRQF